MTEKEIRNKISKAIGRLAEMPDDEICELMDEIKEYMRALPESERSQFYWSSCAETIAMAVPDSYHKN